MKSILFANQKGGVGKSTLASNMLTWFSLNGYKTKAIDTDPQLSLYNFLQNRYSSGFDMGNISFEDSQLLTLPNKLTTNDFDYIVIDTQGHANVEMESIFNSVDCIIVPMQPSSTDYEATVSLLKILLDKGHHNKFKILINSVPTNSTKNAIELLNTLKQNGIPCFNTMIGFRNIYKDTAFNGQGIHEYETDKTNEINAKHEFEKFIQECLTWINK